MKLRPAPILGAFFTLAVCYLLGVIFFYGPIAAGDSPTGPLVPDAVGFFISIVCYIAFFVWVAEELGHGLKAAWIIAGAQFLLVNVDNVLAGKRGLSTAAASTVLLLVSWTAVGLVYQRLRPSPDTPPG